jgi:hypothetical protein
MLMLLTVTGFHCANSNLGLKGPYIFLFICCVAYLAVSTQNFEYATLKKPELHKKNCSLFNDVKI